MRPILIAMFGLMTVSILGGCVSSIETAPYSVVSSEGDFEVRSYPKTLIAETLVDGALEDAGNKAFRKLFKYISGANRSQTDIAMTAPVIQEGASQKIPMTAPVEQQKSEKGWAVAFVMPSSYTMSTLPIPTNPEVKNREVPPRQVASIRYSGTWSETRYKAHLKKLQIWMADKKLVAASNPIWARYNSPFALWFLRRNEILIPLSEK